MSNAITVIADSLAVRHGMGQNGADMYNLLTKTVFPNVPEGELLGILTVVKEYGLNPFTREIFCLPKKGGGFIPVVSVDGWAKIINEHPMFDGMEFTQDADSCTCKIYRKDRTHAVSVTEFMAECAKSTDPWKSHPKRMLRHKSLIQCARMAFSFSGIYDQDEAENFSESAPPAKPDVIAERTFSTLSDSEFAEKVETFRKAIAEGKVTTEFAINAITSKFALSDKQVEVLSSGVFVTYESEKFATLIASWKKAIEEGRATAKQIIEKANQKCVLTAQQIESIKALEDVQHENA